MNCTFQIAEVSFVLSLLVFFSISVINLEFGFNEAHILWAKFFEWKRNFQLIRCARRKAFFDFFCCCSADGKIHTRARIDEHMSKWLDKKCNVVQRGLRKKMHRFAKLHASYSYSNKWYSKWRAVCEIPIERLRCDEHKLLFVTKCSMYILDSRVFIALKRKHMRSLSSASLLWPGILDSALFLQA